MANRFTARDDNQVCLSLQGNGPSCHCEGAKPPKQSPPSARADAEGIAPALAGDCVAALAMTISPVMARAQLSLRGGVPGCHCEGVAASSSAGAARPKQSPASARADAEGIAPALAGDCCAMAPTLALPRWGRESLCHCAGAQPPKQSPASARADAEGIAPTLAGDCFAALAMT